MPSGTEKKLSEMKKVDKPKQKCGGCGCGCSVKTVSNVKDPFK
tara:strand:- start:893 stop:1021 length:129 start_codon:yes stop_codon:yes gene_type:complete